MDPRQHGPSRTICTVGCSASGLDPSPSPRARFPVRAAVPAASPSSSSLDVSSLSEEEESTTSCPVAPAPARCPSPADPSPSVLVSASGSWSISMSAVWPVRSDSALALASCGRKASSRSSTEQRAQHASENTRHQPQKMTNLRNAAWGRREERTRRPGRWRDGGLAPFWTAWRCSSWREGERSLQRGGEACGRRPRCSAARRNWARQSPERERTRLGRLRDVEQV